MFWCILIKFIIYINMTQMSYHTIFLNGWCLSSFYGLMEILTYACFWELEDSLCCCCGFFTSSLLVLFPRSRMNFQPQLKNTTLLMKARHSYGSGTCHTLTMLPFQSANCWVWFFSSWPKSSHSPVLWWGDYKRAVIRVNFWSMQSCKRSVLLFSSFLYNSMCLMTWGLTAPACDSVFFYSSPCDVFGTIER